MEISREDVKHIALLARLGMDENEVEKFRQQISNILDNFDILKQVDTEGVPPTAQSITLQNVVSEDKVSTSLPMEDVLANAPQREADFFKVRAVMED